MNVDYRARATETRIDLWSPSSVGWSARRSERSAFPRDDSTFPEELSRGNCIRDFSSNHHLAANINAPRPPSLHNFQTIALHFFYTSLATTSRSLVKI